MNILFLVLVVILIAFSSFFVAAEFAVIKVRSSRIQQLVEEGNRQAIAVNKIQNNLDEYLSAAQLGITITSLIIGWLGEPAVKHLLEPLFISIGLSKSVTQIISFILAFSLITFFHVVVGELAPKTFAIQRAETIALLTAKPLILFYRVMFPFIWLLNTCARFLTRALGLPAVSEHDMALSEEEIRIVLSESYEKGEIDQSEFHYVNQIFEFNNRVAKEIMIPRTEIVALSKQDSFADHLKVITKEKYTRYPVIEEDKDTIIGMVNMKELLTQFITKEPFSFDSYIYPIEHVMETIPIPELFVHMQKARTQMVILLDEYGGTSGLVTMEDILEEIFGEIRDEFDADESPHIEKLGENHYLLDGKVLLDKVNDLVGTALAETEIDTIGGFILTENIHIQPGEAITIHNIEYKVLKMDGHTIKLLEMKKN